MATRWAADRAGEIIRGASQTKMAAIGAVETEPKI
jgi:hypothetical protein